MDKIKFSIIVPIYNVKNYLERCLNTLIGQTYQNIEIILVDDGSTDGSSELVDIFEKKDNRIKTIHKVNEGLGFARNSGMNVATGDYLFFVDSDDFISINFCEVCAKYLDENNVDILSFDKYDYHNGKVIDNHILPSYQLATSQLDIYSIYSKMIYNYNSNLGLNSSTWSRVYSMKFILRSKYQFVSERIFISEDFYSDLLFFNKVNSLMVIPYKLYYYCYNGDSLSRSYRKDRIEKILFQYSKSLDLCAQLKYPNEISNAINMQTINNILGAIKTIFELNEEKNKKKIIYSIIENNEIRQLISIIDIKEETSIRKLLFFLWKHQRVHTLYFLFKLKYRKRK